MDHLDEDKHNNQEISKSKCTHMHAEHHFSYLLSALFNRFITVKLFWGKLLHETDLKFAIVQYQHLLPNVQKVRKLRACR